jgi:prenyltransferase beta subunit
VGAAARLLGVASFLSTNNVGFIALCEGNKAGFGKEPGAGAEILHSFYACAGLSLESADTPKGSRTEEDELIDGGWTNLEPIHPLLGITCRSLSIPLTVSTLFERE